MFESANSVDGARRSAADGRITATSEFYYPIRNESLSSGRHGVVGLKIHLEFLSKIN